MIAIAPAPRGNEASSSRESPPVSTPGDDLSIPKIICKNLFIVFDQNDSPGSADPGREQGFDNQEQQEREGQVAPDLTAVGEKRPATSPRAAAISTSSGSSIVLSSVS